MPAGDWVPETTSCQMVLAGREVDTTLVSCAQLTNHWPLLPEGIGWHVNVGNHADGVLLAVYDQGRPVDPHHVSGEHSSAHSNPGRRANDPMPLLSCSDRCGCHRSQI